MVRLSAKSISINPNVRCLKIYPTERTTKNIRDLKTVGIKLNREQAIHLARVLLGVAQEWNEIDVTAYRFEKRKTDETYHITVTNLEE